MDDSNEDLKKRGKRNRQSGKKFELDVRKDLESRGYIVCKWTNTVDLDNGKLIQAKSKFNPFLRRVMSEGSGFPDFIIFRRLTGKEALEILKGESIKDDI